MSFWRKMKQCWQNTKKVKYSNDSQDAAILSTVLVCNPDRIDQEKIIQEISRALKPGGLLYLCDFLLTPSEKYVSRYEQHAQKGDKYGIYKTTEGTWVRHHRLQWILDLLQSWDLLWLEQINDATMNGNLVCSVHIIAKKWDDCDSRRQRFFKWDERKSPLEACWYSAAPLKCPHANTIDFRRHCRCLNY